MLSRAAESLFWMARYIERAEDLTRLLAVNFNTLLDFRFLPLGRQEHDRDITHRRDGL